ncbi:RUS1 family protein C16orf58 homolog isoform X1 [Dendronephthya gigantea]|uniref:RUS1 family protein C16orf58 homolog isoform X1 n=1 Tax=Dendronephthya gigantea TaxID=151771 RepID=UPI001069F28C|nr:RUS1 family protein C16orf58 homolog isoform X1 [Dendronephthya gigantea]
MAAELIAEESYGEESLRSHYLLCLETQQVKKEPLYKSTGLASINKFIKDAFLPQGYPHSVSRDYLEYQMWDTCQAFCSSIVSALAAQAMLKAYGVGDEKASILAATFTWLLKDGAGMVGRIIFTWLKGTELDCHAKKWRLAADVINDLTYCIELLAPRFREYFLIFACLSSLCRSLVGVCGGATRAALTQHQARRDNMADVSAKDGSQETMVNLLAFLVNLVLVPLVTGRDQIIWLLFAVFTSLHLYCNFRAVSAVIMETINSTRLHLLVENFITHGHILSPQEISEIEPILTKCQNCLDVNLGCPFSDVISSGRDFYAAFPNSKETQYIMKLYISNNFKSGHLNVALHRDITSENLLQCYFQIAIMDLVIRSPVLMTKIATHDEMSAIALNNLCNLWQQIYSIREMATTASWDVVAYAHNFTLKIFPTFLNSLKLHGWVTSRTHLGPDEWRVDWNVSGSSVGVSTAKQL